MLSDLDGQHGNRMSLSLLFCPDRPLLLSLTIERSERRPTRGDENCSRAESHVYTARYLGDYVSTTARYPGLLLIANMAAELLNLNFLLNSQGTLANLAASLRVRPLPLIVLYLLFLSFRPSYIYLITSPEA